MRLSEFSESLNEDIFFFMYNSFNDFYEALVRSSNYYVLELVDRTTSTLEVALILLILSIVSLALLIVILLPVVRSVNLQKDKVLSLFCDIDDSSIRILSQRCEKFINKLQTTEENANDEGLESNEDLD